MGFRNMSMGSLVLIAFLALLLFGPGRLKALFAELGEAIKHFKKSLDDNESSK